MKISTMNWIALAVAAALCVASGWYYPYLPDPVPTHWNISGQADGWMAKPMGVWLMPVIIFMAAILLIFLPRFAPRGFRLDSARKAYDLVILLVVLFLAAITLLGYRSALGHQYAMQDGLPVLLGLFFIALGNYLAKFPKNFFIGIRTPWTLASDAVWTRTHRLGGWLFFCAGLVIIGGSLFQGPEWLMLAAIVTAALVPVLYSLLLYRKLHGFELEE
jgi:uncharacterized membrane protein